MGFPGNKGRQAETPKGTSYAKRWHMEAYGMCAWKDYCNCKENKPT